MTNRLHSLLLSHLVAPLDAVYLRIDEDQLDGAVSTSAPLASSASTARAGAGRSRLRHVTH